MYDFFSFNDDLNFTGIIFIMLSPPWKFVEGYWLKNI